MKKLILKKDVVEALSLNQLNEVQGGLVVNPETRGTRCTCPVKTLTQTIQRPPVTQTCPSQCQTSACC